MTGADRLLRIARACFDESIVARVFEPLVADWEQEHRTTAGIARVRSSLRGCSSFALSFVLSLPKQLQRPVPERVMLSGWIATEVFALVGALAQVFLIYDAERPAASYLIPAAVVVALPLALVPAAILVSTLGRPVEARSVVLRLALVIIVVLVPLVSWINPISNQAWRERQRPAHETVLRGPRELTLSDLFSSAPPGDLFPNDANQWTETRRHVLLERGSVLFMPLTMAAVGLAIAGFRRWWLPRMFAGWGLAGWLWLTVLDVNWVVGHVLLLTLAAALYWYAHRTAAASVEARS